MSSLSQASRLAYLPSAHDAFQGHAAHRIEWSICLGPRTQRVPVYPQVLPHSSRLLHGAARAPTSHQPFQAQGRPLDKSDCVETLDAPTLSRALDPDRSGSEESELRTCPEPVEGTGLNNSECSNTPLRCQFPATKVID